MRKQRYGTGALRCPKCGSLVGYPVALPEDGTGTLPETIWFCWPCLRNAIIALGVPVMVRT